LETLKRHHPGLVILLVLVLRLPFLNQPIQGDDVYYLYGAEHAQIDPAHPHHAEYVFLGQKVSMRGHPHPPLNTWFLAGLLALLGDVHEVPFHAAYLLFSLIAALAALSLARRFSPHPLLATILFLVTPTFVINGTSLESDLPFVALWLASVALFIRAMDRRSPIILFLASIAMALSALSAYQSLVLIPILFVYTLTTSAPRGARTPACSVGTHADAPSRPWLPALLATLTPLLTLALWQLFERLSTGTLPASILASYLTTYQALEQKLKSAGALTVHLGWLIFPILAFAAFGRRARILILIMIAAAMYDRNPLFWLSIAAGAAVLIWCAEHWRDFLAQWILIFFAASLAIFFAGSARYLLPIALPIAILATRQLSRKWLYAGIALGGAISLALTFVNYRHWSGYREFANTLANDTRTKRVWVNGEWGLRYYFESNGALPLERGQAVRPGDIVVSSGLAYPLEFTTGGGVKAEVAALGITSRIPLRLIAIGSKSAYSRANLGLRPFDISRGPIDFVRADMIVQRTPTLEYLSMNAPEASQQIVSGIYDLEDNRYRWMSARAVLLLKAPPQPAPIQVQLFIPDNAPARTISLMLDDRPLREVKYDRPGPYTITTDPTQPASGTATLTIAVDKTFSVPGDGRELGIILTGAGFQE
jgi:4-amino-4-deoxy-L-arabinose transferase-like glycosyltransferase